MGDLEGWSVIANLIVLALNLKIYTEIFKVRRLTGEDK